MHEWWIRLFSANINSLIFFSYILRLLDSDLNKPEDAGKENPFPQNKDAV